MREPKSRRFRRYSVTSDMTYARVYDKTVMADYLQAMEMIEGEQRMITEPKSIPEKALTLLDKLGQEGLSDQQQQILDEVHRGLTPH